MTKAQEFIKKYAPQYEGSDTIPHHAVLALMESFADSTFTEAIQNRIDAFYAILKSNNSLPTPFIPTPPEAAILDAVINEDKMTLPYKVGDRFTNGIEVDFYDKSIAKYWCKKSTGGTSFYLASELDQFTLIDNDFPHVEHTGI